MMALSAAMDVVRLSAIDVEAFLSLREAGLTDYPGAFRYTVADDARIEARTWRDRLDEDFVVAARDEGRWMGMIGLAQVVGEKLDHKALVWGLYVRPDCRRRGVADALMSAMIERGRGRVRLLQLTVMAENGPARALCERHGFRVYGIELRAVREGAEFRDEVLMWLPLEPA